MFGSELKIDPDQKLIIEGMAKHLGLDEDKVLFDVIESGFFLMLGVSKGGNTLLDIYTESRNNIEFMKKADLFYKLWEAGDGKMRVIK